MHPNDRSPQQVPGSSDYIFNEHHDRCIETLGKDLCGPPIWKVNEMATAKFKNTDQKTEELEKV
jgi:hypothetical protein